MDLDEVDVVLLLTTWYALVQKLHTPFAGLSLRGASRHNDKVTRDNIKGQPSLAFNISGIGRERIDANLLLSSYVQCTRACFVQKGLTEGGA